ncbi:MAG: DsbA family oxidoreductase [Candidatus Puniceispirillaceae bacterium]
MTQSVDVEIYADIICPWCYIGKKRLDAAFAARPHVTPRYTWRCFLLNPTMPPAGIDRQAYLVGKFGNAAKAVYGRIAEAGLKSGIDFNFDGIKRTPDSRKTHRYLLVAAAQGHDLSDAFFKAYFIDGRDIGDDDELIKIAHEQEFTIDPASLADPALDRQIANDVEMSRQLRVDGVPFMIFAGQYAIAGAHMPEHLIPAIDGCLAKPAE